MELREFRNADRQTAIIEVSALCEAIKRSTAKGDTVTAVETAERLLQETKMLYNKKLIDDIIKEKRRNLWGIR